MAVEARFRKSVSWQKSMDLATMVYDVTRTFPKEEMFGLTSQLRRASVSIASNIAEGQGRSTVGEFIQFLGMRAGLHWRCKPSWNWRFGLTLGKRQRLRPLKRRLSRWESSSTLP